jgi:hypothetical protein
MSGAARKSKLTTYRVTVRRTVEMTADIEVVARSADEAEGIADAEVDVNPQHFKNEVTAGSTKAKVKRG